MTSAQQREAARQFFYKWNGRGREDEDARSYWLEILTEILGVEHVTDRVDFEKKVKHKGSTRRIDVYIPETRVLIEQKSLGIELDKPQAGHNGMTPYEQAKDYDNDLTVQEKSRWIVVSNFAEIWVYDMSVERPQPQIITLDDLPAKYHMLDFLVRQETSRITEELQLSMQAGQLVGELYEAFKKQYPDSDDPETLKSLNKLCVRLVFCLYAEDADIFGSHLMFRDYLQRFQTHQLRKALLDLFHVLNQKPEERDEFLKDDDPLLAAFPYVNGGLFADEDVVIPPFTEEIRELLLEKASAGFNWSGISPTIFGALFESTLNQETRRSGGMHYTSLENIHKVIDPLFLDDLKAELDTIKHIDVLRTRDQRLRAYQDKLASLKFLDPAAGSGNFLTESYLCLRRLENECIALLQRGQITMGAAINPIKVSICQFYGIEINDFAATVARTALWIAESQMMRQTEDIVHMSLDFLPLKTYVNIVCANALRVDWETVVSKTELSYILGNPPFVGARIMSVAQKLDVISIFGAQWPNVGNLDYVCCWYKKSADFIHGTDVRAALVSTNSVSQGETVANLWSPLMHDGVHIDFAYRTFRWDSEAMQRAHVHCVIIGFSCAPNSKKKTIFDKDRIEFAENINGYLVATENVFVDSRKHPICPAPEMGIGNKPIDGGYYLFSRDDMEDFIKMEPAAAKFFKPWYGSEEFINRRPRYCLWLGNCKPAELRSMPECMKRVQAVRDYRLKSNSPGTRKLADRPTRFHVENMPRGNYIVIPEVSSEKRRYIPMGFFTPDILCSNLVRLIPDAKLYHFGVLTSNVHMAWMRAVCGRLKSDYRYSKDIVYNNFPWPEATPEQRDQIAQTAQAILDVRARYPDSSLADLYDDLTMPTDLRKAHQDNDRAVMRAYGMPIRETDEAACVTWLFRLYNELTEHATNPVS